MIPDSTPEPDRRQPRDERIEARAHALAKTKAAESRQASELLRSFARQALSLGIAPTTLRARAYRGKARFRTDIEGWYLRRDRSVGVDVEGRFYILSAPSSVSARVKGVSVMPSDPPLELGRGARDGESMPLSVALAKRLEAGTDYPS